MNNRLFKPIWTYKDIMAYCGCKQTKAYQLMATCRRKHNGGLVDFPSCVKRDSFLAMLGTTAEREIELIKKGGRKSGKK